MPTLVSRPRFPTIDNISIRQLRAKIGRDRTDRIKAGYPLLVVDGYRPNSAFNGTMYVVAYMQGGKNSRYVKLPHSAFYQFENMQDFGKALFLS